MSSNILLTIPNISSTSNGNETANLLLAIGGLGILFGAVYGIKRKTDNNSEQIFQNRSWIKNQINNLAKHDNPKNIIRMTKEDHLILHTENLKKTLHREDVKEKCRKLRKTPEFRAKMSDRMKKPETRSLLSKQAKNRFNASNGSA